MVYIITGTSSGIGYEIAKFYLEKGNKVIGIARTNTIEHSNFIFLKCDLSDYNQLKLLSLKPLIKSEDYPIRLINNAGILGEINRSFYLSLDHYKDVANINIVAVQYLCSYIIDTFGFSNVDLIINITSGAAQRPMPSWSAYAASKAAIDSFATSLVEEIKELGGKTRVFNIAPGVVDTPMQKQIRASNQDKFSQLQHFVDLKKNNQLRTPEEVAKLLNQFIENNLNQNQNVIHRL
ncbi:MAG: SDR family NAD(P)-dependent oxidoreductase [Brumimicrobium sp.]